MMAALSPWHEGERALQRRLGVADQMEALGARVMRDRMPDPHRSFFAQLPFMVVGSVDADGQPWASALAGPPGFVHAPDAKRLRIDAGPQGGDPLADALAPGAPIGLLGIEAHTRRRNRVNGRVAEVDATGFSVDVQQSFGNCPKYIQAREPVFVKGPQVAGAARHSDRLDAAARRLVHAADTFFIATAHPAAGDGEASHGVDVSHRGGRPGFIRIDGDDTLTVPDFVGNAFFNTLGNMAIHPQAGLLFIDFASGDLLQLAVLAELLWDGPEVAAFEGAERLLRMKVTAARHTPAALPLRWGQPQPSPFLQATGRWPEAKP
jgi:hypothetical protein